MGVPRPAEVLRCEDALAHLGLLADGELQDASDLSELRGHVAVCASCELAWRRLIDGKRALQAAALARADDERVPASVLGNIEAFVDADVARERVITAQRLVIALLVVVAVVFACR